MPQLFIKLIMVFISNSQVTQCEDLKHIIKTIDKEELLAIYTMLNALALTQQDSALGNRLEDLISMLSASLDTLNKDNDTGIELHELAPVSMFSYYPHYVYHD
jgi:hypothetical protein